jgi:hypothetical protein
VSYGDSPDDEPLVVPVRSNAADVLGVVGIVALLLGVVAVYVAPRWWPELLPEGVRLPVGLASGVLSVSLWVWLQRSRTAEAGRGRRRRRTRNRRGRP